MLQPDRATDCVDPMKWAIAVCAMWLFASAHVSLKHEKYVAIELLFYRPPEAENLLDNSAKPKLGWMVKSDLVTTTLNADR